MLNAPCDLFCRAVGQRISEVTGAPIRYMEPFQVLRYERGQFYKTHHDQNAASFTPQGPRVYTFYMYLSTPEVRRCRGGYEAQSDSTRVLWRAESPWECET
uniref:Prolyl 4-hydroxylase alpha subunit Fe(2+) 2OG dioxygenase domain-containing protein n=1 Tax=Chrysotila carterae TaxID=13221 RepID=A0A7S4BQ64_CHRCT